MSVWGVKYDTKLTGYLSKNYTAGILDIYFNVLYVIYNIPD